MPVVRGKIPALPDAPLPPLLTSRIHRSYPVGHQQFSRAIVGREMELTISSPDALPDDLEISLVSTLSNSGRRRNHDADRQPEIPFVRLDPQTYACKVVPDRTGLYTFRAHFRMDDGKTRFGDSVADAWVLVDPPQIDDMRLYTLIPAVSGTVADWTADLTRIAGMGFNTIHLLPITSLDASESPYSAWDLFSIDGSYVRSNTGKDSLTQLEDFIEKAKSLGIRLCFDLVLNHVGVTSKIARDAPAWIVPDESRADGMRRARFWSDKGWQSWEDIVLINYEHPSAEVRSQIWEYMTAYAHFWAKYADYTDGFIRFDNLHSSDGAYQYSLTQSLRGAFPKLGIIAEYFTDDDTLLYSVPTWGLNLLLATPWNHRFVPQLREYLRYIHRISEHVRYFMPITSHDAGSPAQEFGNVESTIPRYIAAALLGTGATGITQGVEWGDPVRNDFIGRQPKIDRTNQKPMFGPFITRVNQILAEHPTFRRGNNCYFVDDNHPALIAAFRKDEKTRTLGYLVICNFDIMGDQEFEADLTELLGLPGPITASDLISNEEFSFDSPVVKCTLSPCAAMVLVF